jgi:23S rRNA pseudouridine955/2504/2580 synthase
MSDQKIQEQLSTGSGPLCFTVQDQEDQKSLVRVISKRYPQLRSAAIYQALRRRDIRVNGQRLRADLTVARGDEVMVFLPAGQTAEPEEKPGYSIILRSGPVLVIRKRPDLAVQAEAVTPPADPSLLDLLRRHVGPDSCLCHRLDRQTGGLMLAALDETACREVRRQMQQGLVVKRYACLVRGIPDQGEAVICQDGERMLEIRGWLEKKAAASAVFIHDHKQPGDIPIVTRYRVRQVYPSAGPGGEPVSALEVELVTGRTHQIRAHLAHIGHPLLGDGKYGRNEYNRHFRSASGPLKHQELWSVFLQFSPNCTGPLAALAGQVIRSEPDFSWKPD